MKARVVGEDFIEQSLREILNYGHTLGHAIEHPECWPSLLATMQRDKKARGGMLHFIVLDGSGRPTTLEGPDESLLFLAYQNVAEAD